MPNQHSFRDHARPGVAMPNQHSKQPARGKPVRLRLRQEEREDAQATAEARRMTIADVIRERCGWAREDGRPNEPWSNRRAGS
jgi:hypothetical protein